MTVEMIEMGFADVPASAMDTAPACPRFDQAGSIGILMWTPQGKETVREVCDGCWRTDGCFSGRTPYGSGMRDSTVRTLSRMHTLLYRASGGRVGTRLVSNDMLLLTTTGSLSERRHTVPLLYLRDGADLIVIASYGGRPYDPDWYRNLVADPVATVTAGAESFQVVASTMGATERASWWQTVVEAYGDYATYQSRTNRVIPVVRLQRSV
jgi:deazaflavin-dependent oxidoreductase (nitroreductase family)